MSVWRATRSPTKVLILSVLAAISLSFMSLTSAAQQTLNVPRVPPPNDNFANRLVISLPSATNTPFIDEATIEVGEPLHQCASGGPDTGLSSVWFEFTVGVSGTFSATTEPSTYEEDDDNLMSLYDTAFNTIACNDDFGGDWLAAIAPIAIPAGTYYIQVSAYDEDNNLPGSFLILQADFVPDITYTPTNTPTDTPTSTFTPSNTPTTTPTNTLTYTPTYTPSNTPTITLTPTPTYFDNVELLINGSFEDDTDANDIPDGWEQTNPSGDKRKCNKPTKIIAYDGECVYQYKGGELEKSKLKQDVDLGRIAPIEANGGDTLILTGMVYASGEVNARAKVRVVYIDNALAKGKITAKILAPTGSGYTILSNVLALELAGTPATVRVSLTNRSLSGKVRFDALALNLANDVDPRGSRLIPVPGQ